MRWNGINATMQSLVQFAAPAAAGAVLTFRSLRATLLIDVLTAAVGVGLFGAGVLLPKQPVKEQKPLLDDMRQGLQYTFSDLFLSRLLLTYGIFIFFSIPAGFLASLFVSRVFGNTYWYLTAVELVGFAGMTLGGFLMSVWGGFRNRVWTLLSGIVAFGSLAVGMGVARTFWFYLALMLIYGIALTVVQTATTTLIQENTDTAVQGRVFGLLGTVYSGFLPVGMAIFGPLADVTDLRWVMIGAGAALILLAVFLLWNRKFRVPEKPGVSTVGKSSEDHAESYK